MNKELLQQWLINYKVKIGANPYVVENGKLLHLTKDIGGFNEWAALTYNLNVLANMMMENKNLHKGLDESIDTYVKHLEILAKIRPPDAPTYAFAPPTWLPQYPLNQNPPYSPCPTNMYPGYTVQYPGYTPQPPAAPFPANQNPGNVVAQYPNTQYPTNQSPGNLPAQSATSTTPNPTAQHSANQYGYLPAQFPTNTTQYPAAQYPTNQYAQWKVESLMQKLDDLQKDKKKDDDEW